MQATSPHPTSLRARLAEKPIARSIQRMAARIPIYLADTKSNPGWAAMFLFGRFLAVRSVLATLSGRNRAPVSSNAVTDMTAAPPAAVVDALQHSGVFNGFMLPVQTVQEIRSFAETTLCYASMRRDRPFLADDHAKAQNAFDCPILVGHFLDAVERCPAIDRVRNDPLLHAVAAEYLRTPPKIISTRLWWSFPVAKASEADLNFNTVQWHFHHPVR